MSTASGAESCIRAASSYAFVRAAMSDSRAYRSRKSRFRSACAAIRRSRSEALVPRVGLRLGIGDSPAWNGVAATDAPRYPPVNCTGDEGRPMLTNVGRFLLALPKAYETQLPNVGWSNGR